MYRNDFCGTILCSDGAIKILNKHSRHDNTMAATVVSRRAVNSKNEYVSPHGLLEDGEETVDSLPDKKELLAEYNIEMLMLDG